MKTAKQKIIITLFLIMVMSISLDATTAEAAKKTAVKTNKSSVTVYVGKSKTIKVKNKTKKKVKVSVSKKKIAKAKVNGKKIKITGKKAGTTKIKVKVSGFKTKSVKVKVKKKSTKSSNKLKGASKKYKTFKSYPYKTGYNKLNKIRKECMELNWKYMPKEMKDLLCYLKVQIKFVDSIFYNGVEADGLTTPKINNKYTIKIKIDMDQYNDSVLIHEAAHCYDIYHNYELRNSCENEYNINPYKYGDYAATSLAEFYAEKIANKCMYDKQMVTEKMLLDYFDDNLVITKYPNGSATIAPKDASYLPYKSITFNGIEYWNGMTKSDYDLWFNHILGSWMEDKGYTRVQSNS